MIRLVLALFLLQSTTLLHADANTDDAINAADKLVKTLDSMASLAKRISQRAQNNSQRSRARMYAKLNKFSINASADITDKVISKLEIGRTIRRVSRTYRTLAKEGSIHNVDHSIDGLTNIPTRMADLIEAYNINKERVQTSLDISNGDDSDDDSSSSAALTKRLSRLLDEISDMALEIQEDASLEGRRARARKFRRVKNISQRVSTRITHVITLRLEAGAPKERISKRYKFMISEGGLYDLDKALGEIDNLTRRMQSLVNKYIILKKQVSKSFKLADDDNNNGDSAIDLARSLVNKLKKISRQARRVSENAEDNDRPGRARKFRKVKNISARMSAKINDEIVLDLESEIELRRIHRVYSNMLHNGGLKNLDEAIAVIRRMPTKLQSLIDSYNDLKEILLKALEKKGSSNLEAIKKANELVDSLVKISKQASRVAQRAEDNGRTTRVERFRKVKRISLRMSERIKEAIISKLEDNVEVLRVARRFNNMIENGGLKKLEDAISAIRRIPLKMQETIETYNNHKLDLVKLLGESGSDNSRAIKTAKELSASLVKISKKARRIELNAQDDERPRRARKFRKIKNISLRMSKNIKEIIVSDLENNIKIARISRKYNRMLDNGGLKDLDAALASVRRMPQSMEVLVGDYDVLKNNLKKKLGGETSQVKRSKKAAQQLVSTLIEMSTKAEEIEHKSDEIDRIARARRFRRVKVISLRMSKRINNIIVDKLEVGVDVANIETKYNDMLEFGGLNDLDESIRVIRRLTEAMQDIVDKYNKNKNSLSKALKTSDSVEPQWKGKCTVVLENIFGREMDTFIGTALAQTKSEAVKVAKQNGMDKCTENMPSKSSLRYNLGFFRCKVTPSCNASKIAN